MNKKLLVKVLFGITSFLLLTSLSISKVSAQECGDLRGGGNFPTNLLCADNGYCGIRTAVGCIPVGSSTNELGAMSFTVVYMFMLFLGIGTGVAFLLIIYAGFIITTSAGDPAKLSNGKQLLMAAISGLLLIVLSITLLRIIGSSILNIPSF